MATPDILSTADGLKYLPPDRESALFGFLQAHVELTRALDQALSTRHGSSLGGYEVLNRLARADESSLRMSDLAGQTPLSLSRVSRVVDDLVARGHVERRACAEDRRVSYATLTEAGRAFLREAQETFHELVEERFLGRLTEAETKVLADVFGRLAAGGEDCKTALS
jgi:MarR family 2-MHQ and catechol resistance regulon transcriptional repressor